MRNNNLFKNNYHQYGNTNNNFKIIKYDFEKEK